MNHSAMGGMPEWLHQRANLSPQRLALVAGTTRLTFAELDALAATTAGALPVRDGGDRIALLAANGVDFTSVVHAVARLGATLVPLHTRWTAADIATVVSDCAASLIVHDHAHERLAARVSEMLGSVRHVCVTALASRSPAGRRELAAQSFPRVNLAAPHSVMYTSGTTGNPKGAVLTYANHLWSAIGSVLNLGLRADDCWLACLPLYHVGGLAILLRGVIYGIPVVVHERFDPAAVNRAIDDQGVTIVSVVATMLQGMLEERAGRPYPASLRCVLAGGGPVPRNLLAACAGLGVPVVQTYGLTEASSQVTALSPEEAVGRLGSAGRPLFATEVRVADETGSALPPGSTGEILVRGPTVMSGYLDRPRETAAVMRDGWLATADVGYLDAEGYLYVRDRRDGLIISGGENVYATEVEEVLRAHPGIADAGVTGEPDERWGQRVVATVSLRGSAPPSPDAILAFCRERLAAHKVPRRVRVIDALPRNAAGKLIRRALREDG